ncbi:PREDICTED: LOW QUALITY PROTEIN: uncharacterized protein LOC108364783 [Rhagoletis zephyria]|uniref:LOW QUALITY PROTEIN: uncharacterized protein LOC108364783 n=1 Tax=Rhagoletis zephyria TaxID=28612 RepID=UPI0008119F0C|nr:PREDICTED: LOW QUALITY PROTEIN: uncharacterized protein LOC108364783 [Rhagoletis zephyria]
MEDTNKITDMEATPAQLEVGAILPHLGAAPAVEVAPIAIPAAQNTTPAAQNAPAMEASTRVETQNTVVALPKFNPDGMGVDASQWCSLVKESIGLKLSGKRIHNVVILRGIGDGGIYSTLQILANVTINDNAIEILFHVVQDNHLKNDIVIGREILKQACGYGAMLLHRINNIPHVIEYFSKTTTSAVSRYHSYELETLAVVQAVKHYRHYFLGRKFVVYVIEYFSKTTTSAESRYHSYELETLAVVQAVKHYRHYLLGRKFVVYTDCNSLKASRTKIDLTPRVHRWWAYLQSFDFDIQYREGKRMAHVDFLSRNPIKANSELMLSKIPEKRVNLAEISCEWFHAEQQLDADIAGIVNKLNSNELTEDLSKTYELRKGILFRKVQRNNRTLCLPVVPRVFKWSVINQVHESIMHLGKKKTLDKVYQYYWFDNMNKYVRKFVDNCITCKSVKGSSGKKQAELHPIPKINVPWHTVHVDITGKLSGKSDLKEYVIVQIDAFTKYVYLFHTLKLDTESCMKALKSSISLFGVPNRIIADQGRCFTSSKFSEFCSSQNIKLHLIATGASRANGQVERVMSTLKNLLTAVESSNRSWQDALGEVQFALNCTTNRSTAASPLELLIGKEARPLGLIPPCDTEVAVDVAKVRNKASENMGNIAAYDKIRFDKGKAPVVRYKVGDYVLLKNEERHQTKLDAKFRGPFLVIEVLDGDRYMLKSLQNKRTYKYCNEDIRKMPNGQIPSELDIENEHPVKSPEHKEYVPEKYWVLRDILVKILSQHNICQEVSHKIEQPIEIDLNNICMASETTEQLKTIEEESGSEDSDSETEIKLYKMTQTVVDFINTATRLMPDFDGKPENLRSFLDALSLIETLKGDHETVAINLIKTKLKGNARNLIENEATIQDVIRKLTSSVKGESVEVLSAKILNIRQNNKSANTYCNEVETLTKSLESAYISDGLSCTLAQQYSTQIAVKAMTKNCTIDRVKLIMEAAQFNTMNEAIEKFVRQTKTTVEIEEDNMVEVDTEATATIITTIITATEIEMETLTTVEIDVGIITTTAIGKTIMPKITTLELLTQNKLTRKTKKSP